MKAALILLALYLVFSIERVGFRKNRFVFRLDSALLFAGFILVALLCAGCDSQNVTRDGDLVVYTDTETGCQYVRGLNREGITPRMGADGKQICREVKP